MKPRLERLAEKVRRAQPPKPVPRSIADLSSGERRKRIDAMTLRIGIDVRSPAGLDRLAKNAACAGRPENAARFRALAASARAKLAQGVS
jgi:hypothetical protein